MALTRQIDDCLHLAGWRRIPASQLYLNILQYKVLQGDNGLVNVSASTGVNISVDAMLKPEELNAMPSEKRPELLRAAIFLNDGILANLSPNEDPKAFHIVAITAGVSKVMRIDVGKKP